MSPNFKMPTKDNYDVIIVGGAIYGSSVAWFLTNNEDFNGSVLVVEMDPSYEFASTSLTNSCIRQQFSQKINIFLSQHGANYVKNFKSFMNDDSRVPEIIFHEFGYMYLANNKTSIETLKSLQKIQKACGAGTKHLTPAEIKNLYPFYNIKDIKGANHNIIDEGYFDGNTVFYWWKKKARENGVEYIDNEVVEINLCKNKKKVASVTLKTGQIIPCENLVNASGPRACKTSKMVGIDIPVEPRKRYSFIFKSPKPLDRDLPLTIDPSGVHIRSDGQNYLAGCGPEFDPAVRYDDFSFEPNIWEEKVWPILANRIPHFETVRLINSWVGHYAYNTFDQNAILGRHPDITNFIFVNGFSGHGLQQSPGIGKCISELIIFNQYRSLDLSALDFNRITENKPLVEVAVI